MESRRPLLLRPVEDYWGILLLLIAWQAWVIANSFNPIVMPTPVAALFVKVRAGEEVGNVGDNHRVRGGLPQNGCRSISSLCWAGIQEP